MLSTTPRTTLGRSKDRGRTDRDDLYAVLDAGLVCHLGVVVDGSPMVVPTGYGRIGDTLYLHGSTGATSLRAAPATVCVTVTHLDGVVLARSAFHHSVNYRSAMVYGLARLVDDPEERLAGLRAITEQLAPGQWDAARAADPQGARRDRRARPLPGRGVGEGTAGPAERRRGGLRPAGLGGRAAAPPVWGAPEADPAMPWTRTSPAHRLANHAAAVSPPRQTGRGFTRLPSEAPRPGPGSLECGT